MSAIFSQVLDAIEDGLKARDHKFAFTRLKRAGKSARPTEEEIEVASPLITMPASAP